MLEHDDCIEEGLSLSLPSHNNVYRLSERILLNLAINIAVFWFGDVYTQPTTMFFFSVENNNIQEKWLNYIWIWKFAFFGKFLFKAVL